MQKSTLIGLLSTIFLIILVFSVVAWEKHLFPGDLFFSQTIQCLINPRLTTVMIWISWPFELEKAVVLTVLTAVIAWIVIGRLEALMVIFAGIMTLFNYVIKFAVSRSRPTAEQVQILVQESNKGFPSSHAFFTTIFLGMLAYLFYTHANKKYQRILSILVPVTLILLVGFSRIYLGVHWASDIIGGYLLGAFFLVILTHSYKWLRKKVTGIKSL
jgi:membrane-associated phospholipid phosphatase